MMCGLGWGMEGVKEGGGVGSAVVLRGVERVRGLVGRTQGPALLCKAMDIDRRLNGRDLVSDDLFIAEGDTPPPARIARRARIGVDYAGQWARRLLRFYVSGNAFVSRK